ncbi:MAG: hypothetical protein M1594_00850 [Candidatus Marsarchaeota archaeon]|nr:hypothetical protein [Candidatus Marsarchaeota archaeon]
MKGQWLTFDLLIGALLFTFSLGVATHYIEFIQREYSSTVFFQPNTEQAIANAIASNSSVSYLPQNWCEVESNVGGVVFNNCTYLQCSQVRVGKRLTNININSSSPASCGAGCYLEVEEC